MSVDNERKYGFYASDQAYPMLQDVVDARAGEMAGPDDFLPVWQRALSDEQPRGRRALLLLEVLRWQEGLDGVGRLARKWQDAQPIGYHYWLEQLKEMHDWSGVRTISQEALRVIRDEKFRETIAGFAVEAGDKLDDPATVLTARREKFIARSNDAMALNLIHEYYSEKFNRHSAFRRDVQFVVGKSDLLKQLGFPS
jgi:hypothetical protein